VADHVYPQYPARTCPFSSNGKPSRHALCGLSRLRETLAAHNDAEKRIWITELSWSSCRCHYQVPVGEADQAVYLRQAYSYLARRGDVPVALWFNLRDIAFPGVVRTDVGSGFGLLRPNGSRKPAFLSYSAYARNQSARGTISRPSALRVGKRALLRFTGRSERPRQIEAFVAPKASSCAPTAFAQARRSGARRLLRPKRVGAGSFSQDLAFVPSRAVAERVCGYLAKSSDSLPDAGADTLMPLPLPPGGRCRAITFGDSGLAAGIVTERLSCSRAVAALTRWRRELFEPQRGPSGYRCAVSPPDDGARQAYDCRGSDAVRLSFILRRPGAR
jgi:hypothetical protein